jgi:hypothetical protein
VRDDIAALASAVQITNQQLEGYLREMLKTICDDLTTCCGETPVLDFTELGDVPHSYVGEAGKVVRVNATEDGLEFFTLTLVTTFLQLSDTPSTYAGSALFFVRVNAGATALEFFNLTATLVTTFLQLTDTPSTYAAQALKFVRVNAGETALEFFTLTLVTAFTQLSDVPASYAGAALKVLRVNAGANAVEFFTEVFTALGDVPTSYSGKAGTFVVVNTTETGLEFTSGSGPQSPTATQAGRIRSLVYPGTATTMVIGPTQSNDGAGGITTPALVSTTLLDSTWRCRFQSAGGAGSEASCRVPQLMVTRGSSAGAGGFRFSARWATSLGPVAQQRSFVGLINLTTAITNVNPSTLLDLFGVSYNSTGTQLLMTYNDGSGTATQDAINGGVGFPVDATTVYELVFSCSPDNTVIDYIIRNLSSGLSESGQKTTNLPTNTLALAPQMWVNNGTTASAVRIDLIYMQVELYG